MNNSEYEYILSHPTQAEGERHNEAKRLTRHMVWLEMSDAEILAILNKNYAAIAPRCNGKEFENIISWCRKTVTSTKSDGVAESKPVDRKRFKIGTYHTPAHVEQSEWKPLPKPIANGTEEFLKALFKPDDPICWNNTAERDADGKWKISGPGTIKTRDEWIAFFKSRQGWYDSPQGAWFRINPCTGFADRDVIRHQYVMVESDKVSREQQYSVFLKSGLPIKAIVDSGGKSVHAFIEVDAKDINQYKERCDKVYKILAEIADPSNTNPSRFARIAGFKRDGVEQALLATNIGAPSWDDWESALENMELPTEMSIDSLLAFDRENDPDCVLGKRWLCRGGTLLIQGQSGVGKSTLTMQAAVYWAVGRDFFGISHPRNEPLKIAIIQAENDKGDMAEMLQDSIKSMELLPHEMELLKKNLRLFAEKVRTGNDFLKIFENVALRTKADMVFVDPLLAYIGGDLSKAETISTFFRNGINDILERTRTICAIVHHMGKPKQGFDVSKADVSTLQFAGLGSSDLQNWSRETMTLVRVPNKENEFELCFSKRSSRNRTADKGKCESRIKIKHSDKGQVWEYAEQVKTVYKLSKKPEAKLKPLIGLSLAEVMIRLPMIGLGDWLIGKTAQDIFDFETGKAALKNPLPD